MTMDIERGWFYLADLDPQRGTEPGKTRPVLVLQTDLLNQHGHPQNAGKRSREIKESAKEN